MQTSDNSETSVHRPAIAISLLLAAVTNLAAIAAPPDSRDSHRSPVTKLESALLPNAHRLTDKVISGGQPEGDAAFAELKALGVKTVISVDGAQPDVAGAKKHGLRYVHLPHGYDGISDRRLKELAKAVRDLPGPIYIHCHHGKHHSPAAAAAACVAIGTLDRNCAMAVLKSAGTSLNYRGLYDTVASATPLDRDVLDRLSVDFRAMVDVPPMADAMVAVEGIHDHLKAFAAADWKTLAKDPDLDPAHEALLLKEQFTELLRSETAQDRPVKFRSMLQLGQQAAGRLEAALRATPPERSAAGKALAVVSANCQACHRAFRDVPLGEKYRSGGTLSVVVYRRWVHPGMICVL